MLQPNVSDLPYNWRVLASQPIPAVDLLTCHGVTEGRPATVVLTVRKGMDLRPVRDWLGDNDIECRVYGRWTWEVLPLRTDRVFSGAVFTFEAVEDAALFRLAWCCNGGLLEGHGALEDCFA